MGLLRLGQDLVNRLLAPFNVRVSSLTAERAERRRLETLLRGGHFDRAVFPVPAQFLKSEPSRVLAAVKQYAPELDKFSARGTSAGYCYHNDYFFSPDAEVLYAMVRMHGPRRIVEVGSGNSTLLFRAAIDDASLATRLVSIDPDPRIEVGDHAHELIRQPVESAATDSLFGALRHNDFLFVDSSHQLKAGGDVLRLLLSVLPTLAPGVIVHLHDIFLPFEYPREWLLKHRWQWNEQYLVQALLQGSAEFDVLWAGHYLQRTQSGFAKHFRHWRGGFASSLWLRRTDSR